MNRRTCLQGIRDNHTCGKVADFLAEKMTAGSQLSVLSGYFTIYSYDFRNNTKGKQDEEDNLLRKSRYKWLMDDIIEAGVKTKVLLLSATPVNNNLKDLRNQIYSVTEGRDVAFAQSSVI